MRLPKHHVIAESNVQNRTGVWRRAGGVQRIDARTLRAGAESTSIGESA
jgi:hypothetical protein